MTHFAKFQVCLLTHCCPVLAGYDRYFLQGFPQKQRLVHQRFAQGQFDLLPHPHGKRSNDARGRTTKGPQDRGLLWRTRNGPPALASREVLPLHDHDQSSHAAPGRASLTSLVNNLHDHGGGGSRVEDSSESSNAPAAFLVKGRKRLRQAPSSDEEDEHAVCAASSPEY